MHLTFTKRHTPLSPTPKHAHSHKNLPGWKEATYTGNPFIQPKRDAHTRSGRRPTASCFHPQRLDYCSYACHRYHTQLSNTVPQSDAEGTGMRPLSVTTQPSCFSTLLSLQFHSLRLPGHAPVASGAQKAEKEGSQEFRSLR